MQKREIWSELLATDRQEPSPGSTSGAPVAERSNYSDCIRAPERRVEIKDTSYSTVLHLRGKKARGKKLEKDEREFWQHNRRICELKPRYTQEEIAEKERLKQIIGG